MTQYFAAVYLDRHDQPSEVVEQVMRATAGIVSAAGSLSRGPFITEADTGSDSAGFVISTAELTGEQATELWLAYPYDEDVLASWKEEGWVAVSGSHVPEDEAEEEG